MKVCGSSSSKCDDPANATLIQLVAYKIAFGSHVANKKKLEQDIQRLYSDLINLMSEASKELVQRGWGDWATVDNEFDTDKLIQRMFQTHDRPVQKVRETRAFLDVIRSIVNLKYEAGTPIQNLYKLLLTCTNFGIPIASKFIKD